MRKCILPILIVLLILFISACGGSEEKEYYPSGELKRVGHRLKDGSKNGLWTSYYRNGNKISSGSYENGKKEGIWTFWGQKGKKSDIKDYWQGKEVLIARTKTKAKTHNVASNAKELKNEETHTKKFASTMEEWKAQKAKHKSH